MVARTLRPATHAGTMPRFDTPPTTWDEVPAGYAPDVMATTKRLRDVVVEALPQCTEVIQGAKVMGYAQYWQDHRNDVLAMISPEDTHVKLYIHHVREDASGQLKVEGSGKNTRHVKLPLDGSWDQDAVRGLLEQVVAAREVA